MDKIMENLFQMGVLEIISEIRRQERVARMIKCFSGTVLSKKGIRNEGDS